MTENAALDASFPTIDQFVEEQTKDEDRNKYLLTKDERHQLYTNKDGLIYVPVKLRFQIIYYFHFGRTGVHQGCTRTHNRINRHFWWPGLKSDTQHFIKECLTCMRRKPRERRSNLGHLITDRPGLIIGVDLFGPVFHNGKRYQILTIIYHFTRFAEAIVTTLIDSQTIWTLLYVKYMGTANLSIVR